MSRPPEQPRLSVGGREAPHLASVRFGGLLRPVTRSRVSPAVPYPGTHPKGAKTRVHGASFTVRTCVHTKQVRGAWIVTPPQRWHPPRQHKDPRRWHAPRWAWVSQARCVRRGPDARDRGPRDAARAESTTARKRGDRTGRLGVAGRASSQPSLAGRSPWLLLMVGGDTMVRP